MASRGEELEFDFNLRQWTRKGHQTCENRISRRLSASFIRSFREDHKSCTTNFTISSTPTSPGYSLKDEIDPSNYSFTRALKALQAKAMHKTNRDWLKTEGVELNSKWNEAEKYICNPLSGEVPMECLSSKTLNSRSFRNLPTIHAPLTILPLKHNFNNPITNTPTARIIHEDPRSPGPALIRENKVLGLKRDVVVQSAPASVSPVATSPISTNRQAEDDDSLVEYALKLKALQEVLKDVKLEEKKEQNMIRKENKEDNKEKETKKKRGRGCFLWMRKMHNRRQPRKSKCIFGICYLIKTC